MAPTNCSHTPVVKINDSTQRIIIIIEKPGDPLNFNRHIVNGTKLKDLKSVALQPEGCTALTGDNRSIFAVRVQLDHSALDKRLKRLKRVKDSKQFPTIAIKNRFHRGKSFVKQFKLPHVNKKGMSPTSKGTSVSAAVPCSYSYKLCF